MNEIIAAAREASLALGAAFKSVAAIARRVLQPLTTLALLHLELQRGPTIGRKRRARRARGRRIEARRQSVGTAWERFG